MCGNFIYGPFMGVTPVPSHVHLPLIVINSVMGLFVLGSQLLEGKKSVKRQFEQRFIEQS